MSPLMYTYVGDRIRAQVSKWDSYIQIRYNLKIQYVICMDAPHGDHIYIQSCSSSTGTILQFASLKYTATVL